MTKWQEQLKKRAENGDQAADDILFETDGMDENQLARYLAENDSRVRGVLQMKSLAEKDADPELAKEYGEMLNKGLSMGSGEGREDLYGNKLKTVDDYMELFGIQKGQGGYTDDDRAAFTNPENPRYFGKIPEDDLKIRAIQLYGENGTPAQLLEDLQRTGYMWQRGNRVEGYGPNNEFQPVDWALSALKGFTLPRVKEAQKEGRPVAWQDVTGDMLELGLNFVPGVGIVSKTGKVIATLPKAAGMAAKTAAYGADVFAVPFLSQAYDVGINTATGRDVPRAKWDLERMGEQAALMGVGKATAKSAIRTGKDIMEGSLGGQAGTAEYRTGKDFLENIGEKTDDLIARRQAMLDRKAELAKQRKNVNLPGDNDVVGTGASTEDIFNAENYRNLTSEAERIANSAPERAAYRDILNRESNLYNEVKALREEYGNLWKEKDEIDGILWKNELGVRRISPEDAAAARGRLEQIRTRISDVQDRIHELEQSPAGYSPETSVELTSQYMNANEAGARPLIQMPDGRLVRADYVDDAGMLRLPGMDYGLKLPEGSRYLEFKYEKSPLWDPTGADFVPPEMRFRKRDGVSMETASRNHMAKKAIDSDPMLSKKMSGEGNYRNEVARDVTASVVFTGAAHNQVFGKLGDIERKRADAYWNAQMKKLGDLTKGNFTPKQRKENFEAIMDVMAYGLDNIPEEKFRKRSSVYHAIASLLGAPDWKHWTEAEQVKDPDPSASSSTQEATSSSSGN